MRTPESWEAPPRVSNWAGWRVNDAPSEISSRLHFAEITPEQREAVVAAHPRREFRDGMMEALAAGMRDKPETAFGTFHTDILEAKMPGYVRPTFCDIVRSSCWESWRA
jgi:hypothetical protein